MKRKTLFKVYRDRQKKKMMKRGKEKNFEASRRKLTTISFGSIFFFLK